MRTNVTATYHKKSMSFPRKRESMVNITYAALKMDSRLRGNARLSVKISNINQLDPTLCRTHANTAFLG